MVLEELLDIFPKFIQETQNDKAGFFIRYSTSRDKWLVAYGTQRAKRYEHHQEQVGCGDTIQQALEDMVVKIKKYNSNDKYGKTRLDKITQKNTRKGVL
jgi:hypothetical protein